MGCFLLVRLSIIRDPSTNFSDLMGNGGCFVLSVAHSKRICLQFALIENLSRSFELGRLVS
ncbi:unnamed protein product [Dovyalis caffra]|uniref:Uncharacterized protein n=1 Tax=Dovyalis caffra TaxID=77055 RepID=A0AAV1S162_9ROSI|nr:unnamed protein product [Dovyalis caffra]